MAKVKLNSQELKLRKKLYLMMTVCFAVIYSLCCFVFCPLHTAVISNISYHSGILPSIIFYAYSICEILAISVAYAVIVKGIFYFGISGFGGGIAIFLGATFYKYLANTAVDWFYEGGVLSGLLMYLANILFFAALEGAQLIITVLIIDRIVGKERERSRLFKKAIMPQSEAEQNVKIQFTRLYDRKNCLMRASLACSVVVFVSKILGYVVNDVWTIILYGLPQKTPTVILMALFYLSNIIFGVICYLVMIFTLANLSKKENKL